MLVVTYVHTVVGTLPDLGQDSMSDAADHADNSATFAAAAEDGLLATNYRKHDAADTNHDADDVTDNDGDAHGTVRTLPSKEGSTKSKYTSKMTNIDNFFMTATPTS